ncbi:MAG TPA: serine/threonine-protein kinase [Pyrinomonadaceae bacterium]|nr:serine/threonine-protein kinase [Pyrinomonadaceae bacterium]
MKICPTCRRCLGDTVLVCPTDSSQLKHQRPGSPLIGNRYFIERLLGSGGAGAVYYARDLVLNRYCALKLERLDRKDRDPNGKLRLRREALVACQLDHRNIVKVYDFGTNSVSVVDERGPYTFQELFVAMELLHGETLQKFLARTKLSPADAVLIARQAAQALAELHDQGVVHRDMKPANLMLTIDRQGRFVLKAIDLGAVKLAGPNAIPDQENLTTGFIGSPKYASPEMCDKHEVDSRSDIYSLGLVLYEMVAGRPAFDDAEFSVLVYKQAREAPAPLTGVPDELVRLINDAIEKKAERRIQTAREFIRRCRELESIDGFAGNRGEKVIAALREGGFDPAPANLDLGFADEETKFAEPENTVTAPAPPAPPPPGLREGARVALTIFLLIALIGGSAVLLLQLWDRSTQPENEPAIQEDSESKRAEFGAEIGEEAETTTDCNLRKESSARSAKVGLVKKGSRVQILDQRRNWRRIRIIQRAGKTDDLKSEDEGWIDGTNLRAVENDQT